MLEKTDIEEVLRALEEDHACAKRQRWRHLLLTNVAVTALILIGAEVFHIELMFKGVEVVGAAGIHWLFFGRSE